jgi:hypothetical protein
MLHRAHGIRNVCHLVLSLMKPESGLENVTYFKIKSEATTYCAHVSINCCNTLIGSGLQQLACDDLLNRKNNAIFAPDSNRSSTVFDCLNCIFDLEVSPIRRED